MFGSARASASGDSGGKRRRLLVIGNTAAELSPFEDELAKNGLDFSTAHAATPAEIREALTKGPWDAILSGEEILHLKEQLALENAYLMEEIQSEHNVKQMTGSSAVYLKALNLVKAAAPLSDPVLIYGESGTGKELFARFLHSHSQRRDRILVKIDCTLGLSQKDLVQRIELAGGGTVFLDEAGALPLEAQESVVQAIQEGKTRVVAVTNRDVAQAVQESQFREDLYELLSATAIRVPPLRERREDIPGLIHAFLTRFSRRYGKQIDGISPEAFQDLLRYSWPGNIRELEHVLERAVVLSDSPILPAGLLGLFLAPETDRIDEVERRHIIRVLEATSWVIEGERGAAARLSLHPSTLRGRMKKLGIRRLAYSRQ